MDPYEAPEAPAEVDCKHWFYYPGFAEWYASLSAAEADEEVAHENQ